MAVKPVFYTSCFCKFSYLTRGSYSAESRLQCFFKIFDPCIFFQSSDEYLCICLIKLIPVLIFFSSEEAPDLAPEIVSNELKLFPVITCVETEPIVTVSFVAKLNSEIHNDLLYSYCLSLSYGYIITVALYAVYIFLQKYIHKYVYIYIDIVYLP